MTGERNTEPNRAVLEKLADAMEASGDTRRAKLIRLGLSGAAPTAEKLAEVYSPNLVAAADDMGAGIVSVAMLDLGKIAQAAIGTAAEAGLPTDLLQELQGFAGELTQRLVRGATGDTFSIFVARGALGTMIGPENPDALRVFDHLSQYVASGASRLGYPALQSATSWLGFVAEGRAFALLRDEVAPRVTKTDDRDAHNALAVRLGDHAKTFLERIDLPKRIDAYLGSLPKPLADDPGELAATMEEGGILFLDELFAQDLESIGDTGKTAAAALRKSARERMEASRESGRAAKLWEAWNLPATTPGWENTTSPRWIRTLALVLWTDLIGPEREHERRNPPALVYPVHEDVARIHSRARKLEEVNGQRALVFDDHDPIIVTPTIADEAIAELVVRGVSLLGTVTAHKALRWEIHEGHSRAARRIPDARALRIEGGWSTFAADVLGMKKKSAAEDLRAIVHAQASVVMRLPTGATGNMLALRETPQRGRTRGSIEIVLGTMLLPHYVHELGDLRGRSAGESKRLVPVVDLPPTVGRGNDHGQQATLSMLVVRELRKRARELAADGSVAIDLDRWAELAREAGLPSTLLGKLLDRWTKDGDDGPAFLEEPSPGRYRLGPAHGAALAFIAAAGTIEANASEAGRRSVEARERKRQRLSRGRG